MDDSSPSSSSLNCGRKGAMVGEVVGGNTIVFSEEGGWSACVCVGEKDGARVGSADCSIGEFVVCEGESVLDEGGFVSKVGFGEGGDETVGELEGELEGELDGECVTIEGV